MNTINPSPYSKEAKILSQYLVGADPSPLVLQLYCDGVTEKTTPLNSIETRLWSIAMKNAFYLDLVDNGLNRIDRYNPIRHRIYLMACILETQPEFSHLYLPKNFSIKNIIELLIYATLAVLKLGFGYIFVKVYFSLHNATSTKSS
jgi:hypothetical protein